MAYISLKLYVHNTTCLASMEVATNIEHHIIMNLLFREISHLLVHVHQPPPFCKMENASAQNAGA